jgi:hypothetical protein
VSGWRRKLDLSDVFRGDAPFPERRDKMVRRIRALDPADNDGELQSIADELGDARDGDEWDGPWDMFYDWADSNRVWVVTR